MQCPSRTALEDAGLSREPEKWLPELRGAELMRHLARMLADGGSEACAAEGAEPPPGDVAAPEGQMADRQGAEEERPAAMHVGAEQRRTCTNDYVCRLVRMCGCISTYMCTYARAGMCMHSGRNSP